MVLCDLSLVELSWYCIYFCVNLFLSYLQEEFAVFLKKKREQYSSSSLMFIRH